MAQANANARAAGVSNRVRFYERDLFATDLSEATVITGDRISLGFTAELDGSPLQHRLVGRVAGHAIVGTATLAGGRAQWEADWKAARVASSQPAASRPAHALAR